MTDGLMVIEPFGRVPRWVVERSKGSYLGYFRNGFGDAMVFLAEPGLVRMAASMTDWEIHERRPTLEDVERFEACDDVDWPAELALNRDERLWLMACLACSAPLLKGALETVAVAEKTP